MNFSALVDSLTFDALQLEWLKDQLRPAGAAGRRAAAHFEPYASGREEAAAARLSAIWTLAQNLQVSQADAVASVFRSLPDALPILARVCVGEVLEDADLLELQRFLDGAKSVSELLADAYERKYFGSAAREVAEMLEPGRTAEGFYLDCAFDETLRAERAKAQGAAAEESAARARLAQRVTDELGRPDIGSGEFIIMRDEVPTLPPGLRVTREAPTYYLCELELDEAALDALQRREEADASVAGAERSVRERLSATVRDRGEDLRELSGALGDLDLLIAQVRFTQRHRCIVPEIVDDGSLDLEDARYLPLADALEREHRRYEPISISFDRVCVVTGPNMGGKSAALRTCGFLALLCAFGIPVPARSARIGLMDRVGWLGIASLEREEVLLSTFAREIVRLNELLNDPAHRMLLLVDEFARTTTPREGQALSSALVLALRRRKRTAILATHLSGVASSSKAPHFAVRGLRRLPTGKAHDLKAALDELTDAMDYRLAEIDEDVQPAGDAIALARLLGTDDALIADATQALEKTAAWSL